MPFQGRTASSRQRFSVDCPFDRFDHNQIRPRGQGGIILSAGNVLGLPVRYVGIGENMDDLKLFEPEEFVNALLGI